MPKLRRSRSAYFSPLAAEVLDTRAMLSGATAAVHAAVHYAAVQNQPAPPAPSPAAAQQPAITAHLSAHGTLSINKVVQPASPTGKLTVNYANLGVATTVKATFSLSQTVSGAKVTVKGSFTGTISSFQIVNHAVIYNMHTTAASVTITGKDNGSHPIKATARYNPADSASGFVMVTDSANVVLGVGAVLTFQPGSPNGLSGEQLALLIQ